MSYGIMILGESGTGKSASLRNLDPQDTLLIQAIRKPLPFQADWKPIAERGNVFVSDGSPQIINAMNKTSRPVIVIDDFQYILSNEYMRRSDERGFDKFSDIGRHAWDILTATSMLDSWKRVYVLAHTEQTDIGKVKCKTIGKLLDEKITVEGMFSIVLRTVISNGNYLFSTKNNGNDTVKTPMGLFEDELIANDLKAVDEAIVGYYGISLPEPAPVVPLRPQHESLNR
ncbi:MAG: ATP-binding protein [Betaproteobacteria bacterium]|nr:ATP-binding protein [Betaproteobacteria bacterium]